jgi:hypothetical protein
MVYPLGRGDDQHITHARSRVPFRALLSCLSLQVNNLPNAAHFPPSPLNTPKNDTNNSTFEMSFANVDLYAFYNILYWEELESK